MLRLAVSLSPAWAHDIDRQAATASHPPALNGFIRFPSLVWALDQGEGPGRSRGPGGCAKCARLVSRRRRARAYAPLCGARAARVNAAVARSAIRRFLRAARKKSPARWPPGPACGE